VQSILESLEFKLKSGWKPQRTLYVAFGHDEEVSVTVPWLSKSYETVIS